MESLSIRVNIFQSINLQIYFQSLVKSLFIIHFRSHILELMKSIGKVYRQYGNTIEYRALFPPFLTVLEIALSKFIFWHYVLAMTSFLFSPVLIYLIKGNIELMFPIAIPFVDEHTIGGYLVKTLCSLLTGFCGLGVYIYSDGLFTTLSFHVLLMSDIFKNMIYTFNEMMKLRQSHLTVEIREHFRNMLNFHNDTIT